MKKRRNELPGPSSFTRVGTSTRNLRKILRGTHHPPIKLNINKQIGSSQLEATRIRVPTHAYGCKACLRLSSLSHPPW
jgi:hypothetical protein